MKVTLVVIMMVVAGSYGYSRGAPRCNLQSPVHSGASKKGPAAEKAGLGIQVAKAGGNEWKVTVTGSFKGLLLKTQSSGDWSVEDSANFKTKSNKGDCVTHKNPSNKSNASFSFISSSSSKPKICAVIVKAYSD